MDVARPKQKKTGRNILIGVGMLALVGVTVALFRLQPAAPSVDAGPLWTDSVKKGDMVREVRGPGNLVADHIRQVTAPVAGRIENIIAVSGQTVAPNTVLIDLSNPDAQILDLQAQQSYNAERQNLANLKNTLATTRLNQELAITSAEAADLKAKQDLEAADSMAKKGLVSRFDMNNFRATAMQTAAALRVARQQLELSKQTADSQIAVQAEQVDRMRVVAAVQDEKMKGLHLRAGDNGVVQDLALQLGQWIPEGFLVAKVVQPGKLKAVLRIPESQAKDVSVGQSATVDTRNGIIPGHVSRKDPASQAGTITVDVALDGPLPAGAVPDLSIDGTIQIEKLKDILSVGRPAYGAGTGTVGLFKIVEGGAYAVRVQVELGASSANFVEVKRGLNVKDKVILSDMSQWDAYDRVRLKY